MKNIEERMREINLPEKKIKEVRRVEWLRKRTKLGIIITAFSGILTIASLVFIAFKPGERMGYLALTLVLLFITCVLGGSDIFLPNPIKRYKND
ncbi:MAG: hypothetical protein PHT40_00865 [Patescibacteria group bacterium]|nr:hypothetical protein [Patescibacteria group bacterium]